jgi:V8-like Glu-specific endopeptidase
MMSFTDDDRRLAKLVRASAAQFATVFEKMQTQQPIKPLDALPAGPVGQEELIAHGIAYARAHGWIEQLLTQCIVDGLAEPDLPGEAERQDLISENSSLQSISNFARGFAQAGIEAEEMAKIIRQVCRIDIAGVPAGTGFLVRPDMVMTAYHVVRPMLQDGSERQGSDRQMKIVFDDYSILSDGYTERLSGRVLSVPPNWLAYKSACHDEELAGRLPEDLKHLDGFLDYALIRLKGVARVGLPPVQLASTGRLRAEDHIHIFQHPSGRALSIDREQVVEVLGADVRFYHGVNTEPGSSGSPCFDSEYRVVGIHQAGPKNGPASAQNPQERNRGVPICHLLPVLKGLEPLSPRLTPIAELTETRPGHPVFGRSETQDWVWSELEKPTRPILALDSYAGLGKTFTYDLLRTLLPTAAHDVVLISATEIASREPVAFAAYLLDQLRYPRSDLPEDEGDTTALRWERDTLVTELVGRMDAGRRLHAGGAEPSQPRGVWILIDDIEKASIGTGSPISAFLYALYAAAGTNPWLRFVLLGFQGDLPAEIRPLAQSHEIQRPTDDELANYIYTKIPPRLQASLPGYMSGFLTLAKMELPPATARNHLEALQAKMRNVARAFAGQTGGGNG